MISFILNLEESILNSNESPLDAISSAIRDKLFEARKSIARFAAGLAVGTQLYRIYSPLTNRALKVLTPAIKRLTEGSQYGSVLAYVDPFRNMSMQDQIRMAPMICLVAPILEEVVFRGDMQGSIKKGLQFFYEKMGVSKASADLAARVGSIFFTSVIFGLVHFTNALSFGCSPMLFLPQVIAATIMGVVFGVAKEVTGGLALPIGLHMGNNTMTTLSFMGFV